MRIIIYGAGGIGSIVGGLLKTSGTDTVLIGRAAHVKATNENGLKLTGPSGTRSIKIEAVTSPSEIDFKPGDVVFLCMKGQDTAQAVEDLYGVDKEIPVFCFQNGIRNEEIAQKRFKDVYAVMVQVGAVYLNPGEVTMRREPPGRLVIGRYPKGMDSLAEEVAERLHRATFFVKTSDDTMPYKWGKLVGNLGNAIGAITNERQKDVAYIYSAAREEMSGLLAKAGIRWIGDEELNKEWPGTSSPRDLYGTAQLNGPIRSIPTVAQSSTWQSLARGQGTVETEFLNGEAIRLADKLGMKAPINAKLLEISLEMAANHYQPGKYTGAQLGSLLGLKPPAE